MSNRRHKCLASFHQFYSFSTSKGRMRMRINSLDSKLTIDGIENTLITFFLRAITEKY